MFTFLARFTHRFKVLIILAWIVLAVVLLIVAPSLSKVGVTDDSQFLPRDTESIKAQNLIKTRFSSAVASPPGSALIVVFNSQGLGSTDLTAARALYDWLKSSEAPGVISQAVSSLDNPALLSTLQSRDGTALLIELSFKEGSSSAPAREAVKSIREQTAKVRGQTTIYVTGGAGVSSDALTSIHQTIDKATLVTVILVVVLLLLIYRSPVAILVPLVTIGVAYLISRSLAGFIAQSGMAVSTLVDAYLVVTLFGIGTDYCLFMVSRYKEELLQHERSAASALTLQKIGPVILASATTVVVALLCLLISRFGMNRNSGLILAMGVTITLIAGLTLSPALISAFGRYINWPAKIRTQASRNTGLWHKIGQVIVRRSSILIISIIVVLAVPYLAIHQLHFSASMLSQMPDSMDSVQGYQILKDKFPAGELNPLDLVIESPAVLSEPSGLQGIRAVAQAVSKIEGVSGVVYFAAPADDLYAASRQLRTLASGLGPATVGQLSALKSLDGTLSSIAVKYPGVMVSPNFQSAVAVLQQISTVTAGLAVAPPQAQLAALNTLGAALNGVADSLQGLALEFNLQASTPFTDWLKTRFFSNDGTITRLYVAIRADPYSSQAIDLVAPIRQTAVRTLETSGLKEAHCYAGGVAADQFDILQTNDADFIRVLGLAVLGILLVTGILLRSLIAPLYMIVTVLFNFGATLGIATWLFFDVLHHDSMIYMLPIFVFVILVAVGADYNIFLVTRIREESQHKPLKEAIRDAVSNTGGVITSCGLILAGTFATLTTAPLQMVFQVGAAIGIGVLIDTFLVRALLIPSIATLLGRWNWWPSKLQK
jgi:putative drug exporter of the RND superfamily